MLLSGRNSIPYKYTGPVFFLSSFPEEGEAQLLSYHQQTLSAVHSWDILAMRIIEECLSTETCVYLSIRPETLLNAYARARMAKT